MVSPTARKILCPRNPPDSGTSSAIRLISNLHQNPPEPHQPSAPEPSGTSSAICPGTLRNLISNLPRNSPEPHQPSAPKPSGTLRNLVRNLVLQLHRIAPELFWAKYPIASFAVGKNKQTGSACPFFSVLGEGIEFITIGVLLGLLQLLSRFLMRDSSSKLVPLPPKELYWSNLG